MDDDEEEFRTQPKDDDDDDDNDNDHHTARATTIADALQAELDMVLKKFQPQSPNVLHPIVQTNISLSDTIHQLVVTEKADAGTVEESASIPAAAAEEFDQEIIRSFSELGSLNDTLEQSIVFAEESRTSLQRTLDELQEVHRALLVQQKAQHKKNTGRTDTTETPRPRTHAELVVEHEHLVREINYVVELIDPQRENDASETDNNNNNNNNNLRTVLWDLIDRRMNNPEDPYVPLDAAPPRVLTDAWMVESYEGETNLVCLIDYGQEQESDP